MQPDLEQLISEQAPTDSGHINRVRERLFSSRRSTNLSSARSRNPIDRVRERLFGTPPPIVPPRYELLERIGQGGFGDVFLALDTQLGRRVAIKLIRCRSAREEARVKRESEALAQVEHPNVVSVHELGTNCPGVYYLVLEYVPGTRLDVWLEMEPRTLRDILEVFLQAARGLRAVHAKGLVHRDLKPANLLVGRDGRTRVLDFGLARRVTNESGDQLETTNHTEMAVTEPGTGPFDAPSDISVTCYSDWDAARRRPPIRNSNSCPATAVRPVVVYGREGRQRCVQRHLDISLTQDGKFVGTLGYASLEQLTGDRLDERTDVFSFCVTLFEALHGKRPFPGSGRTQIEREVRHGRIIDEGPRRLPRWLDSMLRRGLSPHPSERPRDFGEIIQILGKGIRPPRRWIPMIAATAGLTAGLTALALALAPKPPNLAQEWRSAPENRRGLDDRYGAGLEEQLDAFESRWLERGRLVNLKDGSPELIDCLRTGQQLFDHLVDRLHEDPAPDNSAALASMAPARLWFTRLLDPERCPSASQGEARTEAIEQLLQSQILQLEGRYDEALEMVHIIERTGFGPLDPLTGAIATQTGHLELLLDDPAAWTTLGQAAYANHQDVEFFVEVLSLRLIAGVIFGIERSRPEEFSEVVSTLFAAMGSLDGERYVARGWYHIASGQLSIGKDPDAAQEHFERAREIFARASEPEPQHTNGAERAGDRQKLDLAIVDLLLVHLMTRQGKHALAANRGAKVLDRLAVVLGEGHPYLDRCRVDVAMFMENAQDVPGARRLLRLVTKGKTVGHPSTSFEVLRAEAELLYLDAKEWHHASKPRPPAQATMDDGESRQSLREQGEHLYQRSVALERALTPHLDHPRRKAIALITLAIAKTRLAVDSGRPETREATEQWLRHESDPERRMQARDILAKLDEKNPRSGYQGAK